MKRFLDGLVMSLGTLCLFGIPVAAMVMSAWLGDSLMAFMHFSGSAMQLATVQAGTVLMIFCTSASGLALALMLGYAVWNLAGLIDRHAERLEPLPAVAPRAPVTVRAESRGRMQRPRHR